MKVDDRTGLQNDETDVRSYDQEENIKKKFSRATRKYLRKEIRYSRGRVSRKVATVKLIKRMFESELEDSDFFSWLSSELLFEDSDALKDYLKYANVEAPFSGRKTRLSVEVTS